MAPADIILLIVAIAFLILVIFLAQFLYTACTTLKNANQVLDSVKNQLDNFENHPRDLVHSVNEITQDVNRKMKCIDPWFRLISQLGEVAENKACSFTQKGILDRFKEKVSENPEAKNFTDSDLIEFALLGLKLWQKFQTRRE